MKTLVDCGCEARVHPDGSGVEIDYCPQHEAAPEMYEALRLVLALHDNPSSRVPGYHRNLTEFAAPLLDPKAELQLRTALAKADGKAAP